MSETFPKEEINTENTGRVVEHSIESERQVNVGENIGNNLKKRYNLLIIYFIKFKKLKKIKK